jgi:hypothetical protein
MAAMGARIRELEDAGKVATWHPNACGCCITVHEHAEHVHEGWVIGPDGGTDWVVADD